MELLLATRDGFVAAQNEGGWQLVRTGLDGRFVTSLMARQGVILAGTDDGIFRSDDGGLSWRETSRGLTQRHVRWLAFHPAISDLELAGTEPAAIFTSQDGGASWRECGEVSALREQLGWWLPYSPEAGCVRGFAFHGSRAYAAVEVGGVLRSDDQGMSWRLAGNSNESQASRQPSLSPLHSDVHDVASHPSSPDLVLAPTGGGLYRSRDGGDTWTHLHANYVRALWVNPDDANHLLLGPSDGPSGRNGRIVQSRDGGQSWQPPSITWRQNMPERFVAADGSIFVIMANGELLVTDQEAVNWQPILATAPPINAITTMK